MRGRKLTIPKPVGFPPPGSKIRIGQQVYRATKRGQRVKADGNALLVMHWRTTCPDCGCEFSCISLSGQWPKRRRCSACARPGVPVGSTTLAPEDRGSWPLRRKYLSRAQRQAAVNRSQRLALTDSDASDLI